jgi:CBS domain containing-hemolysin-like protein
LWGNVGINVLLTLLSDSVLTGVSAFAFSTAFITIFGEITPQAYFSRNALKMASMLAPVLRMYQILFYLVAKPCAKFLDMWLGVEGIDYMRERDIREIIKKHVEADEAEVEHIEGIGALNFLQIDDLAVSKEGEEIDPLSIIQLETNLDLPMIPFFSHNANDEFLKQVEKSGHKWVVLADKDNYPHLVMDADGFLRSALFHDRGNTNYYQFCHRPIIIEDPEMPLGDILSRLKTDTEEHSDAVIDNDIILLWSAEQKRIITGADILGRLLKGIASHH